LRSAKAYAAPAWIIDLHGAKRLNDIDHVEAPLRRCAEASRASLQMPLHHFKPSGASRGFVTT
jgi:S-adenosylmethionine decarboxylase